MKVCKKCNKQFPTSMKIDGKIRKLNNRRYCLDCKTFGNKSRKPLIEANTVKYISCILCGKQTPTRRKKCASCRTKIRRHRVKIAAVKLLGSKCNRCGYDKHIAAFEFHHKDPKQKDFTIGKASNKSWAIVKKEVLKCELLCANCHRIEHSNRDNEKFLEVVNKYQGTQLL